MRIERFPVELPLREPLATGKGPITTRVGEIVRATDPSGRVGWGDWFPLDGWMARRANGTELALLCLAAAQAELPLGRWLNDGDPVAPRIGVNSLGVSSGCRVAKIKVGSAAVDDDLARIEQLPTDLRLRLDANGAWSYEQATAFIAGLSPELRARVDYLEEPVTGLEELARLAAEAPIAIAADDSASTAEAAARVVDERLVPVLVAKPAVVGWRNAVDLGRRAADNGIRFVVTSFIDSAVGVTAAAHVTAALPQPSEPAGLATSALLLRDVGRAPPVVDGLLTVPTEPGLGIAVSTATQLL